MTRPRPCAVYLGGRNHRQSTKHDNLALAFESARDWYLDRYADERLRQRDILLPGAGAPVEPPLAGLGPAAAAKARAPTSGEKTFREAAKLFVAEFEVITQGERNEEYVASKGKVLDRRLLPFFGGKRLSEVTAGLISEYRVHRLTPPEPDSRARKRMELKGRARLKPVRKWKRPSRSTLHSEIVCLRQVLK